MKKKLDLIKKFLNCWKISIIIIGLVDYITWLFGRLHYYMLDKRFHINQKTLPFSRHILPPISCLIHLTLPPNPRHQQMIHNNNKNKNFHFTLLPNEFRRAFERTKIPTLPIPLWLLKRIRQSQFRTSSQCASRHWRNKNPTKEAKECFDKTIITHKAAK